MHHIFVEVMAVEKGVLEVTFEDGSRYRLKRKLTYAQLMRTIRSKNKREICLANGEELSADDLYLEAHNG